VDIWRNVSRHTVEIPAHLCFLFTLPSYRITLGSQEITGHSIVAFSRKEEWNYAVCREIDRSGDHDVEKGKPRSERQICTFSHMWNLDQTK
jgi:hypothetical protein